MFYFPECTHYIICRQRHIVVRFPHSEIFGLTVARHLPEAYRSHATSFIAILSQGIHHTLLNFPLGNLKTTDLKISPLIFLDLYFILLHKINLYNNFVSHSYNQNAKLYFYFHLHFPKRPRTPIDKLQRSKLLKM